MAIQKNTERWSGRTTFHATEYLQTYYPPLPLFFPATQIQQLNSVTEENLSVLEFYATHVRKRLLQLPQPIQMLEVGGGPTIYQLISAAAIVESIHFTDYLPKNLRCVMGWQGSTHDHWQSYIRSALAFETGCLPSDSDVRAREALIKQKLLGFGVYDVINNTHRCKPAAMPNQFTVVCSNFCIESITDNYQIWQQAFHHLLEYVAPGGWLVMTALCEAESYKVGEHSFPATFIGANDIHRTLQTAGFKQISVRSRACLPTNHYRGMLYATAQKAPKLKEKAHGYFRRYTAKQFYVPAGAA